jgi:hypothetical protein
MNHQDLETRVAQLEQQVADLAAELGRGRPKREHPHATIPGGLDAASWGRIYGDQGHDGRAPVISGGGGRTFDHDGKEW